MRTELLEQEASKVATATAREVVPQLVSTEVQSPDVREAAKAQEKEKRRHAESQKRKQLQLLAQQKR